MDRSQLLLWVRSPGFIDDITVEKTDLDPMAKWHKDWNFEAELASKTFNKDEGAFTTSKVFRDKYKISRESAYLYISRPSPLGDLEFRLKEEFAKK